MNSTFVRYLAFCLVLVFDLAYSTTAFTTTPGPRLFNAEFDHAEIGQVACEWDHWGDGIPVYRDGLQGISDLSPGQSGIIAQKVSFCQAGATYQVVARLAARDPSDAVVYIGIDPTGGADSSQATWSNDLSAEGEITVSAVATGNVCTVMLAFSSEGAEVCEAFVDSVSLALSIASEIPDSEVESPNALVEATARQRIHEAFRLIEQDKQAKAVAYLDSVLRNLSDSRSAAAMALIGLQEVAQGKQIEIATEAIPKEQWQQHQGLDHLRAVTELYPEQTEACAIARCKLGEFYLEWWTLPMAREILHSVLEDFPQSEGAAWAKTHLLNCALWSGNDEETDRIYEEIQDDFQQGITGIKQMGWSDYFYLPRRLKTMGAPLNGEAAEDLREELWATYKTAFPEVAIRAKMENATRWEENGQLAKAMADYREIYLTHPNLLQWSGGPVIRLAGILYNRGWKPEHKEEALELLSELVQAEDCPDHLRQQAEMDLNLYQRPNGLIMGDLRWPKYDNLLYNGDFDAPPDPMQEDLRRYFPHWRVVQPAPNTVIHWETNAPEGGLGEITPAWTTPGGSISAKLAAKLIHDLNPMEGETGFRAYVYVGAEGSGDFTPEEVAFEMRIRFLDGFYGLLSEVTSGPINPCTKAGQWEQILLEGMTPDDCRYAEVEIGTWSTETGRYTAAITHAYLELTEEIAHAN